MCHDFAYIFDTQAVKGWQIIFNWGNVAGRLSVVSANLPANTPSVYG